MKSNSYRFIVLERNAACREVPAAGDEIWIGRTRGFPIALRDRWVSRRHAVLRRCEGGMLLEDVGSKTGTLVNGRRITPGQAVAISRGDIIVCGASSLVCCADSPHVSGKVADDTAAGLDAKAAQTGARLLVVTQEAIRIRRLARAVTVLGTDAACDVRLRQPGIAPRHARIVYTPCGFHVQNTAIHGRLLVNGRSATAAPLRTNSVLLLGRVQVLFAYDYEADGSRARNPVDRLPRRPFRRHLVRCGPLLPDQLRRLRKDSARSNTQLGEAAVRKGYITPALWQGICDGALREHAGRTGLIARIQRLFWRF